MAKPTIKVVEKTRGAKSVTNWKVAPYGSAMQSQ